MAVSIAAHGLLLLSLRASHPVALPSPVASSFRAQLLRSAEASPKQVAAQTHKPPKPVATPAHASPQPLHHAASHRPSARHKVIAIRKRAFTPEAKPSSEPVSESVRKVTYREQKLPVATKALTHNKTGATPQLSASAVKARESRVRNHLERYKYYPTSARLRGIEGEVELSFRLAPGGKAEKVRVLASSGYQILDQAALETVSRAQPFPATDGHYQFRLRFRSL